MKVTIDHSEVTKGLLKKTTYFKVAVRCEFTPEEREVIEVRKLGNHIVIERPPNAMLLKESSMYAEWGPEKWALRVDQLLNANGAWHCFNSAPEAKSWDAALREQLKTLKEVIEENKVALPASSTFEL